MKNGANRNRNRHVVFDKPFQGLLHTELTTQHFVLGYSKVEPFQGSYAITLKKLVNLTSYYIKFKDIKILDMNCCLVRNLIKFDCSFASLYIRKSITT